MTYDAADVIVGCLESLMAARGTGPEAGDLRVVVVDNASTDDTVQVIRDWAAGRAPFAPPEGGLPFAMAPVAYPVPLTEGGPDLVPAADAGITLIHSGANRGFAGGVNLGLAALARDPAIGHFWVLNPDCMVPAASLAAVRARLAEIPEYGLLGGRVIYLESGVIQMDAGLMNRWTGVTGNFNFGGPLSSPPPQASDMVFISGASMVASRTFYDTAGPMKEDYFLYYEEVDWALRRGALPLVYCPGFDIYHLGGSSIGSAAVGRLRAAPFSLYFKHRSRIRFQRRFHPWALPVAWAFSLAQAARTALLRRSPAGAWAILTGSFGLPVPRAVRARLNPDACAHAFQPRQKS
ncbi:MAG: glycosyltransferase family 2 protein [Rhodobacteraceae bacterium]|nr:glycosyltransferase family 2 protein [Paracoccaceae bacterium]